MHWYIGGIIVEKGDFNWSNGNFPEFTEPDVSYHGLVYTRDFPAAPFSTKLRVQWVRDTGAILPPMNAFLISLGMQTLHLRMDRHSSNALEMAKFLKAHPKVAWVNYPGLEDSPEHERCKKYLRAASGVLCFGAVGGKAPHSSTLAWKIPWTEDPGGLQSMRWQRVRHN